MSLVDSHCHLDDEQFDADREDTVQRALAAGVQRMLAIGTGSGPPDLEAAIRLADRYHPVYATVGIHPQYASRGKPEELKRVQALLEHPKVVGLGEVGLDYHWEPFDRDHQTSVFIDQMRIAMDARKPLIVHTRDAWEDTFALLREYWATSGLPCILHCFTGGPAEVSEANERGYYVSFSGVVTYPKAAAVQEAAKLVPAERLLVETDAPYLAPVPNRGKRNEPAFVVHTARKLAELRDTSLSDISTQTTENFRRVFGDTGIRSVTLEDSHELR
jgi:TatD DNase family protein